MKIEYITNKIAGLGTHDLIQMEVGNNKKSADGYLFGLWGLIMHLIVLWGVLDANFHSPILNNLPTVPPLNNPPAKRLFLFVADGLRYRTFAEETPPYLK